MPVEKQVVDHLRRHQRLPRRRCRSPRIGRYERELLDFLEAQQPADPRRRSATKKRKLDDDLTSKLKALLDEFAKEFAAELDGQGVAMPSLKAIRIRIASSRTRSKITSAMKLVAAAKLRRAQERDGGAAVRRARWRGHRWQLWRERRGAPARRRCSAGAGRKRCTC